MTSDEACFRRSVFAATLLVASFVLGVCGHIPDGCGQDLPEQAVEEVQTDPTRSLIEEISREGITQHDLELSTPVMQDLAENKISEPQARSRLVRIADGKLVKFLSNRLFQQFFGKANPGNFILSLKNRGFDTSRLEELQSDVNFYFRPQTETRSAHWEYFTNTLFVPVEFRQEGTDQIRSDLRPHEINTLIHELDHAEKDLRNDLLRMRGKSLGGKIHAGICWGALLCLVGLITTTLLGGWQRLRRSRRTLRARRRSELLTSPQFALGVVAASVGTGIAIALIYHLIVPAEMSDLRKLEQENLAQITRISRILDVSATGNPDREAAALAQEQLTPRLFREIVRLGVLGAMAGAALGLLLGSLGLGPRLLGQLRILKALNYPWALAITCALIGALGLGSYAAWRANRFSKFKAWEISGYYSGACAQRVLEGQRDIAYHNTKLLYGLSLADLGQLQRLDKQGQLKLLLPRRMFRMPAVQQRLPENSLTQLISGFAGEFESLATVPPGFESWWAGTVIEFPYADHPQIFETLFRTSLGLGLDRMTRDYVRIQYNYRGLADFMERSDLDYCVQIRDQVRQARARRYEELLRQEFDRDAND